MDKSNGRLNQDFEFSAIKALPDRHAQSQMNIARKNATTDTDFAVQFDKKLKDAQITEFGMKQCEEAAEKANKLNIALVFTSPLRRTMETTKRIFGNHPNKPRIEVLPDVREIFTDAGDVPFPWTGELEQVYSEYDFGRLDKFEAKKPLWFIEICEEPLRSQLYELIEQSEQGILPSDVVINEMMRIAPEYIESKVSITKRVLKVREMLKERAARMKDGEKIALVAHSDLISFLIAQDFEADGGPIGTKRLSNCEFYEYKLE